MSKTSKKKEIPMLECKCSHCGVSFRNKTGVCPSCGSSESVKAHV